MGGLTEQICHDPSIFTDENQFFATKETSKGDARCYSGRVDAQYVPGGPANDIWGCGHPGAESKLGVRRFPCKVGGQSVMGFMLGGGRGVEGYGDWKHADTDASRTMEAERMSLTNSRSGGVLCCRRAPILEYAPQTVVSQKMINTGLAGNYFDVDLGNALAKKYASIKGKGECKELCMAGNAPRSQCLRVPIMLNSDSTPDLTYELLLKQTSYNKFGRGWIMSADDGAYDRSILMDDSRFGGVALGVGRSYDAFRAVGFLPLGEYVHLVAVWEGTRHRCIWTDSWCKQRASQDHRRATSDTFVWIRIQDMTIINGMDVLIKFVLMILPCLRMMLRDLQRTQRKEWQGALIEEYALNCLHC